MKITDGCLDLATMNRARTSFSASPTYFNVNKTYKTLSNKDNN